MKKLSIKIALMSAIITASIFFLSFILLPAIADNPLGHMSRVDWFFIILCAFIFLTVLLIVTALDFLVTKRIRSLNENVKKITDGNFNVESTEAAGVDELAVLSNNIDKMAKSLNSNEYLNKDFTRTMSHEIKTPLSAIIGYAELIENHKTKNMEIKEYAEIIKNEASRLSNLSTSLMQVSKLEAEHIIKQNDVIMTSKQIRHLITLLQLQWEEKELEIHADLEDFEMMTNKEVSFQIWQNLIINAIKFADSKSSVKIKLTKWENTLKFSVTNFGEVIAAKDKEKIFNLFYKAENQNSATSNGIGLYLTKKIVQKLSGEISFTSTKKEGTTFTVVLPIKNSN